MPGLDDATVKKNKEAAATLNDAMRQLTTDLNRAHDTRVLAQKDMLSRLRLADSYGFVQDTETGEFVHPSTQQRFSYKETPEPVKNSPQIPVYDAKQRKLVYPGQQSPAPAVPVVVAPPVVAAPPLLR
jgi:hypothetical protein